VRFEEKAGLERRQDLKESRIWKSRN